MAGRKSKYETHVQPRLFEIECWARDGLLEEEICKRLGVAVSTFNVYKNEKSELMEALKTGKEIADYKVEESLYKRALGYKFEEVTRELLIAKDEFGDPIKDENGKIVKELVVTKTVVKEVQPDTTAQIFWLKNRKPKEWRDKQEIEHSGDIKIDVKLTD